MNCATPIYDGHLLDALEALVERALSSQLPADAGKGQGSPHSTSPSHPALPCYLEIGGTIYRDGHVVEDSAEIADALAVLEPVLCECEEPATKKFAGVDVCAECWDQLRYWTPAADEGRGR
jgi:hypothetical protein